MRPLAFVFIELTLTLLVICLAIFNELFRNCLVSYIILFCGTYQHFPIKNLLNNDQNVNQAGYKFILISEKRYLKMGHSFVVLTNNSDSELNFITVAYYPVIGIEINHKHDVKIYKSILSGDNINTTYKCWEIDEDTFNTTKSSIENYAKLFAFDLLSQLIPVPFNLTLGLCNCSSFAAAFTNKIIGTSYQGPTPLFLAQQMEKS